MAGGLIPNPGGTPGQIGGYLVEIGELVTILGGPEAGPIGPIIELIGYVVEILADIIGELIKLFSGRPRKQATIEVAQRAMHSINGASRLWGLQIMRLCRDWDIVISDSSPAGQALLGDANKQLRANLESQGVSHTRAGQIIVNLYSRPAQYGQPLPPELMQPIQPGYGVYGDQHILTLVAQAQEIITKNGLTGQRAVDYLNRYVVMHAQMRDLFTIRIVPQPPGGPIPPPPNTLPLGPQNSCPPGYYYDPTQNACTLCNATAYENWLQGGGQWPPPNPPPPPGGGPGDEITDCCATLAALAQQLISVLSAGGGGGGGNPPPVPVTPCGEMGVDALDHVVTVLSAIEVDIGALGGGGNPPPTPVDLSALVDALNQLVAATQQLGGTPPAGLRDLVDGLTQMISDYETESTNDEWTSDELQALIDDGMLPAKLAQVWGL
jgi:hypothetical protein